MCLLVSNDNCGKGWGELGVHCYAADLLKIFAIELNYVVVRYELEQIEEEDKLGVRRESFCKGSDNHLV